MDLTRTAKGLLRDGEIFAQLAEEARNTENLKLEATYSRAAVLASWCALEGWINYVCDDFCHLSDDKITVWEKAFLMEKRIDMDKDGAFIMTSEDDFQSTARKLLFLLKRFGGYSIRANEKGLWKDFRQIEAIRNLLAHPSSEKQDVLIDLNVARKALQTTKTIALLLKEKVYRK